MENKVIAMELPGTPKSDIGEVIIDKRRKNQGHWGQKFKGTKRKVKTTSITLEVIEPHVHSRSHIFFNFFTRSPQSGLYLIG